MDRAGKRRIQSGAASASIAAFGRVKAVLREWLSNRRQFLLYCLIGASGATLDFLIYVALVHWSPLHHQVCNLISTSAGILNNFWLNMLFNFKVQDRLWRRLLVFYAVGCFGIATSALMLYVGIDRLHLDKVFVKLMTIGIIVVVQYNLNRWVSFRKTN